MKSEQQPRQSRTPRQETHSINPSAKSGAIRKPQLGASSWVAMAFPQCLAVTISVSEAIPEGRYNPDAIPETSNPNRILQMPWQRATAIREIPAATADKTIVMRCDRRLDTKLEPRTETEYPMLTKRKSEAASAWASARSF